MEYLQDKLIDYRILAKACDFYESHKFQQIEVPWIIHSIYSHFTSPTGDKGYAMALEDGNSYLVCSAEQGFIRQAILGELPKRKWFYSVSPCFRDEDLDETHSKYFMKLELFTLNGRAKCTSDYQKFASRAYQFFRNECGITELRIEQTPIGLDIMSGDLELGSYGVRQIAGEEWCAYGTGVALPRVSLAQQRNTVTINNKPRLRGEDWVQG